MSNLATAYQVPYVTLEHYSILTGLPESTVKYYIQQGKIILMPKKNPKDRILINMHAMNEIAARAAADVLS